MTRLFGLILLVGCASAPPRDEPDVTPPDAGIIEETPADAGTPVLVQQRPYDLHVPANLDESKPAPLVILLHGYSANATGQEAYFGLTRVSDREGFLYAMPNGTVDGNGQRFWNATDSCCNFFRSTVDDVAYLNAVIDDVSLRFKVDPKRVYVVGHSNGGFMAHRFACDSASRVAAIVSLAGAQWADVTKCVPSEPVSVLQVHGDHDQTIAYGGGHPSGDLRIPRHPGAIETVNDWAALNGCDEASVEDPQHKDLDSSLAGAETVVTRHEHCRGGAAELWTIRGGGHIPVLKPSWADEVWGFLSAHPKP